jgi:hypothetical protein
MDKRKKRKKFLFSISLSIRQMAWFEQDSRTLQWARGSESDGVQLLHLLREHGDTLRQLRVELACFLLLLSFSFCFSYVLPFHSIFRAGA